VLDEAITGPICGSWSAGQAQHFENLQHFMDTVVTIQRQTLIYRLHCKRMFVLNVNCFI